MSIRPSVTTVVNVRDDRFDVYIGRSNRSLNDPRTHKDSIYANPFRVEEYGRAGAIDAFIQHFWCSPHLIAALPTLQGHVLGCWCHPKPCHGHFLAELLNMRSMWREVVQHIELAMAREVKDLLEGFVAVQHFQVWSSHLQQHFSHEVRKLRFPNDYNRLRVAWNEKVDGEWAQFRANNDWNEADLKAWQGMRI